MTRPPSFIISTLVFLAILFVGCAGEEVGTEFDVGTARTEIEAVNQRFETYVAEQQWDSLMTLYTDDALMMAPGAPSQEGGAIRDGFAQMGQMGVSRLDLETTDVEVAGNTAYEVGTYAIEGTDGIEIDQGKYLVVWKNEDGEWKLHRDIYNSNRPMMTPTDGAPGEGMPGTGDRTPMDTASVDTSVVM